MTTEARGTTTAKRDDQPSPWVPDDTPFGARLALVRWRMGWNVKEAAAACGVPGASWRLWEMGGSQPRNLIQVVTQIAERTDCNFDWLLRGRREGSPTREYVAHVPGARPPRGPAVRTQAGPPNGPTPRRSRVIAASQPVMTMSPTPSRSDHE